MKWSYLSNLCNDLNYAMYELVRRLHNVRNYLHNLMKCSNKCNLVK